MDNNELPGIWTLIKGVLNNLAVVLEKLSLVLMLEAEAKKSELFLLETQKSITEKLSKSMDKLGNHGLQDNNEVMDLSKLFARKPEQE